MLRTSLLIVVVVLLALVSALPAAAGKPNFSPAIYADGEAWGTKGLATLPQPNANMLQSFDKIFVFTNASDAQLPVAEAAPGNPDYNGGRWFTHTAEWTEEAFNGYVPVLKSAAEVEHYADMGLLIITPGSFPGGPNVYFQCPLLPDKSQR